MVFPVLITLVVIQTTNAFITNDSPITPTVELSNKANLALPAIFPTQNTKGGALLEVNGRRLKSSALAKCYWNEETSYCDPSSHSLVTKLSESDSSVAKLVLRDMVCRQEGKDLETCRSILGCAWDDGIEACRFVDYYSVYKNSPCVKNAPNSVKLLSLSHKCPNLTTKKCCREVDGCYWLDFANVCRTDDFGIMFGVRSGLAFEKERAAVEEEKTENLWAKVSNNPHAQRSIPPGKVFLYWNVPNTKCPQGYNPLVCNYVDIYLPYVLPTQFYCRTAYANGTLDARACSMDPLCEFSLRQNQCQQTSNITRIALSRADKILLKRIQHVADRKIAEAYFTCGRIGYAQQCVGTCQWFEQTGRCAISSHYFMTQISHSAKSNDDPVCFLFRLSARHGCQNRAQPDECHRSRNCQWVEEHGSTVISPTNAIEHKSTMFWPDCQVSGFHVQKGMIDQDPKLRKLFGRLKSKCNAQKTKRSCIKH